MNQEECIRKLQSRLAQSESQLAASLATVAKVLPVLREVHDSASPHPVDNPAMTAAWQKLATLIEALTPATKG